MSLIKKNSLIKVHRRKTIILGWLINCCKEIHELNKANKSKNAIKTETTI